MTRPLVLIVRDPDSSNAITVYGGDVDTIDIDLGYMDLADPTEWESWVEGRVEEARAIAYPEARMAYRDVVDWQVERYGHAPVEWGDDVEPVA